VDFKKKEKGKISNKKPVKSDNMATSCCILLGESTEKKNTERGQPDKYDEMECTSQRCIIDNDSLLVNELGLTDHGQESSSVSTASEGSELEPKSVKKQSDLAPSETCLKKELSQCNYIGSSDPVESAGTDCRSNLQTESSHQIVCTDISATSCNCKASEVASDLNDDDNLPSQELYYVFDKFILTSGKVGYHV
jgi:terminal uridylyltransferase